MATASPPQSSIRFLQSPRAFILKTRFTVYCLRILPSGEVVHVGSAPSVGEISLSHLDAYEDPNYIWDEGGRRYELPTFGDIAYHDVALKAAFPKAALPESAHPVPAGSAANFPVRDLRLRYDRHEIRRDAQPGLAAAHGRLPRKGNISRETLVLHLRDIAYDFRVRLFYRITPEHDVIERWLEVENRTPAPVQIESLAFATVHFPQGRYQLTRAAGAWSREFVPVTQDLQQGGTILSQLGLNTGHAVNPFYLVAESGQATENAGNVYFGALAFSGNWALRFDVLATDAVRVHGGYEPTGFAMTLAPGESHTTPAMVLGVAADGFGGASRRLHAFALDYVLPGFADDVYRPVLFNSWEATYFNVNVESQIKLARTAAEIGVELFCVDDGWFGARRHDRAGLGDWVVASDVFPGGLNPLIDEVKRLGMRFGLWVEPEMVNPDSDLYRKHPEWVLHYPGRPRTEVRQQLILDFARPEVAAYIHAALDALLREYDITFFKWDMNRYSTEPGSVAGTGVWREHVKALYGIMDRLRRDHPRLDIQSCSGGGGRIDFGILSRTDQVWTSDNTDAADRATIQDGYSLVYPPRAMECWVTHEVNHQTRRHATLDFRFDVAMRGCLGIGSNIDTLSPEELQTYRRKISFYKRIRPIVQGGRLHRLATASRGNASIWQTVSPDQSASVYSAVIMDQFLGHHRPTYRLRDLIPGAMYRLTDDKDTDLGQYSGAQLMTLGIPGDQHRGSIGMATRSRTVLLEKTQ